MTDRERISHAWRRVTTWLSRTFPEGHALLAPGATEAQLRELEATTGRSLPEGWAQLWRENNGQTAADDPGLFAGWTFLSTEAIIREWNNWAALRSKAAPALMYGSAYISEPADAIQEVYSDGGWIPVAKEPMEGNYVGMDFNPGAAGRAGQIINFGRDEDEKRVLATSLPDLIEWVADACESGRIVVEEVDGRYILSCENERLSTALMTEPDPA